MALSTVSLPELRERSNEKILAAHVLLDTLISEKPSAELRRAQKRLDRASDARIEIESVASTKNQRDLYGAEKWNQDFVRLLDVDPAIRDRVWNLMSGKFRRFQEAYCDPHNFVVPKFDRDSTGWIRFRNWDQRSEVSVRGCLVSPDRLGDEMVEHLHLHSWTKAERRQPFARLKVKAEALLLERFKLIHDCAEALMDLGEGRRTKDIRALLIQRPELAVTRNYSRGIKFPVGIHGAVLLSSEDPGSRIDRENPVGGPSNVRPLRFSYYDTLLLALRKTHHQSLGYEQELKQMSDLEGRLRDLRANLSQNYRKNSPLAVKEGLVALTTTVLGDAVKLFDRCIHRHKIHIQELLLKVQECRDSRGQVNPPIVENRISQTLGLFKAFFLEKSRKEGFNNTDRTLLKCVSDAQAGILRRFRDTLGEKANILAEPQVLFDASAMTASVRRAHVDTIRAALVPARGALSEVTARPFSTMAALQRMLSGELDRSLERGDRDACQEIAVKMFIVGKFFGATSVIEQMKIKTLYPVSIPVSEVREFVGELQDIFNRRILPQRSVPLYEERFKALVDAVSGVAQKLGAYDTSKDVVSTRSALYAELRTLLDTIDPHAEVWNLMGVERHRINESSAPKPSAA